MEHTHKPKEWLQITLRIARSATERALEIDICFQNVDDQAHVLAFSNRSRKAELLGLHVFDDNKQSVTPERRDVISLKNKTIEEHVIAPGSEWIYTLKGEVRDGYVEFQGAAYKIPQGQVMTFCFEYQEVKSNRLIINTANMSVK